jgi:hypothetical protein
MSFAYFDCIAHHAELRGDKTAADWSPRKP